MIWKEKGLNVRVQFFTFAFVSKFFLKHWATITYCINDKCALIDLSFILSLNQLKYIVGISITVLPNQLQRAIGISNTVSFSQQ